MSDERSLRVAIIGTGFMGRAHSFAWSNVEKFYSVPHIEMVSVSGAPTEPVDDVEKFRSKWGWQEVRQNWRDAINSDADIIDVCTPNNTHEEIVIAALKAGKHVLCEKPMATSVASAERMLDAAAGAALQGVHASLGFVYRRIPAVALGKQLIESGQIGDVYQFSGRFLQDWLLDPERPWDWRFDREVAGSGVTGDLGAHLIDLVRFLTGEEVRVHDAQLRNFHPVRKFGNGMQQIETDELMSVLGSLSGGGVVDLHASRVAAGRKADLVFEVHGSRARLSFSLQRPSELDFVTLSDGKDGVVSSNVLVTEKHHPYQSMWWEPGQATGYENAHVHQVGEFVSSLDEPDRVVPTFEDGVAVQRVLDQILAAGAD